MDGLTKIARGEHKTAQQMVTDGLREAILNGALRSGRPLRQVEVAERFGVSSVPVREALRQLEGEGLVTFYPRRGAVVSQISREEMVEIGEMREVLELLAFEKALPNLTPEDLADAEKILDAVDNQTDEELLATWVDTNWRFHSTLYRSSGRPKLLNTIKNLHTNFDRYVRVHLPAVEYREKGQEEHRAILRHCTMEDEEGALEALRQHLRFVNVALLGPAKKESRES